MPRPAPSTPAAGELAGRLDDDTFPLHLGVRGSLAVLQLDMIGPILAVGDWLARSGRRRLPLRSLRRRGAPVPGILEPHARA